jgi:hypothetical protein
MLSPEAFELSMEAQLKMRVITDEVENCTNMDELKEQLLASAKLIMRYQQMLNSILKEVIERDLSDFVDSQKM